MIYSAQRLNKHPFPLIYLPLYDQHFVYVYMCVKHLMLTHSRNYKLDAIFSI